MKLVNIFIAIIPVFAVLLSSELLWRRKIISGERGRKFIHILAGVWIAFWPLYLPLDGITLLGISALTLLVYSRITQLFHAIYEVKRRTYGDILFAVALIACSLFARAPWIFTISILFMAVSDGGAAVIGRYWGRRSEYLVFGNRNLRKSILGTLGYVILSYGVLFAGALLLESNLLLEFSIVAWIVLPIGATIIENITPYGIDNLAVPIYATLLLNSLL